MSHAFSSTGGDGFDPTATRWRAESYSLSAKQRAILFRVLAEDASGISGKDDIEQIHVVLNEPIDDSSFRKAWELIAARHPALSASFEWKEAAAPQQSVQPGVEVPVDMVELGGDGRAPNALEAWLERDRARGFNLRRAPLQRVTLLLTERGPTEFVWSFHRILLDRRSSSIVLSELLTAYDAIRARRVPDLPPRPRPFRDYVAWLGAQDSEQTRSYLREFETKKRPSVLPGGTRAADQRVPATYRHTLGSDALGRLQAVADRTQTTLGTAVLAAWAVVLARFTGDEDVAFGTSSSARTAFGGDSESIVGVLTNDLPLHVRLEDARTTGDLLRLVQARALQTLPLQPPAPAQSGAQRDVRSETLPYDTHVLFDDCPLAAELGASNEHGARVRAVQVIERTPSPLSLQVVHSDVLDVRILSDGSRVAPNVARRLLEAFSVTLEQLAEGTERPVAELLAIPPNDLENLLYAWNDTARAFDEESLIHELFERRAARQPDARAVESKGRTFTYREVDEQANRLARVLTARGAGPGTFVAVYLERDIGLVLTLLAICKAGAAYVPLDHRYPADRLRFVVEDTRAVLVVTDSASRALFDSPLLELDSAELQSELLTQRSDRADSAARAADTCYVMYTSGSTGKPKGVVLCHRAVVNTLEWVNRTFNVGPGDRLLFVTSPAFDLSVYDIFGVLGAGATLVIASQTLLLDPPALARALESGDITLWNSTPAALQLLLPYLSEGDLHGRLRLILLSGDWIPLNMLPALRSAWPSAALVSLGGATEAAIWSNYYVIDAVAPDWRSVPYGRPIQNCAYYALDARLRPVPIGCPGELYIGGVCLADGYLNLPQHTAERFLRNPFSSAPNARIYRTGDLVRLFDDGNIELLGRTDLQLKIRGFRVEIPEVEAALARLTGVRDAACTAQDDAAGQKALVAFVTVQPGHALDEDTVRHRLSRTLPEYMVPARVLVLDALPLSSNGKVDRAALPKPGEPERTRPYVPPTNETEQVIVDIWQRLLKRSRIGVTDDFFDVGGHSLQAMRVVDEINRALDVTIHLGTLLEDRNVKTLAARIRRQEQWSTRSRNEVSWTTVVPIQPNGSLPPLICIAGAGGSPLGQRPLATALGPDQPFFGVQYRGADGQREPHTTIAEMAQEFLADIRRLQPHGPYYLAGFSAGGVVAQELARMLVAAGEQVPLLLLLDAFNSTLPRWSSRERVLNLFRLAYHHGLSYAGMRLGMRFRLLGSRLSRRARHEVQRTPESFQVSLFSALDRHVPGPYHGDTLLIRTSGKPCPDVDYRTDPTNGWRPVFTGNFEVVSIDCRHDQLLTERVPLVANIVAAALARARQRFESSHPRPDDEAPRHD